MTGPTPIWTWRQSPEGKTAHAFKEATSKTPVKSLCGMKRREYHLLRPASLTAPRCQKCLQRVALGPPSTAKKTP